MTIQMVQRDALLLQDSTPETLRRATKKMAALRKFFMHQQGGLHLDFYQCHYCDEWVSKRDMTVDHIVPWSLCRITALWNAAFVCRECNAMKGNEVDWCICDRCQFAITRWTEIQRVA